MMCEKPRGPCGLRTRGSGAECVCACVREVVQDWGVRWPQRVTLEPFRSKRRVWGTRESELPGRTPTNGRASAARISRKHGGDWQERQEVGGYQNPGEATWGTSVDKDPGDGGRKQGGVERGVFTCPTRAGPCWHASGLHGAEESGRRGRRQGPVT